MIVPARAIGGRTARMQRNLIANSTPCEKCTHMESQLQIALNELITMKLINDILNEEITALKHPSHADYKDTNLYTSANLFINSFSFSRSLQG
jgi:hypothetical protein